jgi:hypothetical protein
MLTPVIPLKMKRLDLSLFRLRTYGPLLTSYNIAAFPFRKNYRLNSCGQRGPLWPGEARSGRPEADSEGDDSVVCLVKAWVKPSAGPGFGPSCASRSDVTVNGDCADLIRVGEALAGQLERRANTSLQNLASKGQVTSHGHRNCHGPQRDPARRARVPVGHIMITRSGGDSETGPLAAGRT